ncbi:MAG TPA: formate dehydrogenase-N subunit alpha [Candidatus Binataceae bacterium]|nr:formate dehydrogenase-N subunit alpha [Candidatus Binataceae bacterium]
MPGLGASFGRGAATTFQRDLANSDCVLIMGSNMAEAHPVGFRWVLKAREAGGKLIHVDPRFTRTSAMADVYIAIRAGSDVAFLGGIINYLLEHDLWFQEYVLRFTNAATIVAESYTDADEGDGFFAGFDPSTSRYDAEPGVWGYSVAGGEGKPEQDPTLRHPRCVFQVLRRHFSRYTPEAVAQICGCSSAEVIRVAESLARNSGRERTSSIVYALGWTQHSTGVQMIRAAAIIQLLLGNIGRPGGGIMAMRGHCSIQGSTDIPTLYHLLPGYIPQPAAVAEHVTLAKYLEYGRGFGYALNNCAAGFWQEEAFSGYWAYLPRLLISLLKAWYGDAATPENEFGYAWLPKRDDDYSQLAAFFQMYQGDIRGLFLIGQNPAAGAPNAELNRAALRNLDWLVVRDWFEHESANFWYADPGIDDPGKIKTEVFFLPAASIPEKDGTFTNTERLIQWHEKAVDPPGDCRSDAWFLFQLGKRVKELYRDSTLKRDAPVRNLTWNYDRDHPERLPDGTVSRIADEPDIEKVLKEINGRRVSDGVLLSGFHELRDDGSTACGAWIYGGVFPQDDRNRARSRDPRIVGSAYPDWAFAWPANRRVMYNRASADPDGRPWSERKRLVWWDELQQRWVGNDVPDFEPAKPPTYRPPVGARDMQAIAGDAPFIMHPDGRGWLYAPFGVRDGPLPAHFEPRESVLANPLYKTQSNPTLREYPSELNRLALGVDPNFPFVATTYRLTEHYLSGPMSRFNSWLNELQPEMFVELSPELAEEQGIQHRGWMVVSTPRGEIEARAMVTRRIRPLRVGNRIVHQIGLPIHWGYAGETVGAIANDLTALLADPNVGMHEAKAFSCSVRSGRLTNRKSAVAVEVAPRANRPQPIPQTPRWAQPEGRLQWWGLRHRG